MADPQFTHLHAHRNTDPDSIEIGTPGKGGAVKIYGNTSNPEEFARKIEAGFALRKLAQDYLDGTIEPKTIVCEQGSVSVRVSNGGKE